MISDSSHIDSFFSNSTGGYLCFSPCTYRQSTTNTTIDYLRSVISSCLAFNCLLYFCPVWGGVSQLKLKWRASLANDVIVI